MKFLVLFACLSVANAYDRLIIDGVEASTGQHPDLVSLQRNGNHFCGGTLYDKRTVVTAAHCFYGNSGTFGLAVVAGENDLTLSNSANRRSYRVSRVIIHPDYRSSYHYVQGDDIAILKLSSDADLGTATIKAGDFEDAGVDIPPARKQLQGGRLGRHRPVRQVRPHPQDDRRCVRGGGTTTNACRGDSGGPLYCTYNGKTRQVGIVSYGRVPCGQVGIPTVYTRVATYRRFIDQYSG
uniref:Peptidase S1 domain-containing protein n=1 Tax=Macrostomum lignano TaxID=282301 RepID=A0A1I8JHB0_9PLAT